MATTAAAIHLHTIYLEESNTQKERLKDPLSEPKKVPWQPVAIIIITQSWLCERTDSGLLLLLSPHSSLSQRAFWGPNPKQSREVELVAKLKCAVEWNERQLGPWPNCVLCSKLMDCIGSATHVAEYIIILFNQSGGAYPKHNLNQHTAKKRRKRRMNGWMDE